LLHLGDIYYSGTRKETKERFLDTWPLSAGKVSRALNGNHEMYSGGFAYFDDILPAFSQSSSYFALQNTNWLLVGLDTAYTDHALDTEQILWLTSIVRGAGRRKLILFSHHQPFSRLDMLGRCIGNGGIPSPRKKEVLDAIESASLNGVTWKRLSGSTDAPSCLVLDGPNVLVTGEEHKFAPHGYLTLDFDGPDCRERVHLADGTEIFNGKIS
jgi:hypothetical protein